MRIKPLNIVTAALMLAGAAVLAKVMVEGVTYGLQQIEVEEEQEEQAPKNNTEDNYPEDIVVDGSELQKGRSEEILKEQAEIKELNIEILENRAEELVFQISMDDFIDSYNGYYWADRGERYLLPSWEWRSYVYDSAIHSNHKTCCYHYSRDETILPLPTITVYAPSNADYIQEITVNFDDHSYMDQMYEVYEEMCFYTLRVMFPDISDEKIQELYTALNKLAYENVTTVKYTSESVPSVLYYRGNIGLYPYFALGESVHLCVIPVTQARIEEMRRKGVEIIGI